MFAINDARKLMKLRVTIHKDGYALAIIVSLLSNWEKNSVKERFFWGGESWQHSVLGCLVPWSWAYQQGGRSIVVKENYLNHVCWLVLCQCNTSWNCSGRRNLNWENVLFTLVCGQANDAFSSLMIDRGGPSWLWRVWCEGLVVLGPIKKQVEQARESKPVPSIPRCLLHQFLPPGSFHVSVPSLKPFDDGLWMWN